MTGRGRLGIGGLSPGYLPGRLSPPLPYGSHALAGVVACRNPQHPRQRPPSHDFGYLRIRSLVLPSNEQLFSMILMR